MSKIEVLSEVTGKVWKLQVEIGTVITPEDSIMVVESMKMEIPVFSGEAGTLIEIRVAEGDAVEDGQVVAMIET